jgi:hypothetical protein
MELLRVDTDVSHTKAMTSVNLGSSFFKDKFWQYVANHLLPRRLVYFATMKGIAIATTGEYKATVPSELNAMAVLERLDLKTGE